MCGRRERLLCCPAGAHLPFFTTKQPRLHKLQKLSTNPTFTSFFRDGERHCCTSAVPTAAFLTGSNKPTKPHGREHASHRCVITKKTAT